VTRRLLVGYLALAVVVLVSLEMPLGIRYAHNERQDLTSKVERDAVALASLSEDTLERKGSLAPLAGVARSYRAGTGGRIVIVDAQGRSRLDSSGAAGRSFATRPEIATALSGRVATGVRSSRTLGERILYVAVPVASGGVIRGAVRITYPMSAVDRRVRDYWLILAAVAGVVLAATALVGLWLARSIVKPLVALEDAAGAIGEGALHERAPEEGPPEIRDLARAFNETVAKLELLVRSQEEFVADAPHELRTPLTALKLRLENLEHDVGDGGRKSLAGAIVETERLGRLVEELLVLARADASAEPASVVDVSAVAAGRATAWQDVAEEHGVAVRSSGDPLRARVGPTRVAQVLDNLLANAIEASPQGAVVEISTACEDGWVELRVADEGPGLSPNDRERAFDRFWRGRTGGFGSGLGLAIVRRLVRADGGDVELRDARRGGLEAVVRLRPGG
jgi:signal transduction histidine kinase